MSSSSPQVTGVAKKRKYKPLNKTYKYIAVRLKTELCLSFSESGSCPNVRMLTVLRNCVHLFDQTSEKIFLVRNSTIRHSCADMEGVVDTLTTLLLRDQPHHLLLQFHRQSLPNPPRNLSHSFFHCPRRHV
ncbi:hypothetical protein BLNAU_17762 [Blattamonas nauphoetae]|uniref:Uncharacterized protein n=1 Tax=Blattamonas nauphoetae TaxID=2049346 RepID=A0ABQ9X682_9EUKA|nr:hypothetical protein BLNAU_17762 [Blattamonas nauphoetae]